MTYMPGTGAKRKSSRLGGRDHPFGSSYICASTKCDRVLSLGSRFSVRGRLPLQTTFDLLNRMQQCSVGMRLPSIIQLVPRLPS